MTVRQINQALRLSSVAFCGIALFIVLFGVIVPVDSFPADGPRLKASARHSTGGALASLPTLQSFDAVWPKPLRRPLVDPPTTSQPQAAAAPIAAQVLQITLVGTIGNSLAMLRSPDGSIFLEAVGDQISGAEVAAIRPGQIDVRYSGQTLTLTKPAEIDPQTGAVAGPAGP